MKEKGDYKYGKNKRRGWEKKGKEMKTDMVRDGVGVMMKARKSEWGGWGRSAENCNAGTAYTRRGLKVREKKKDGGPSCTQKKELGQWVKVVGAWGGGAECDGKIWRGVNIKALVVERWWGGERKKEGCVLGAMRRKKLVGRSCVC